MSTAPIIWQAMSIGVAAGAPLVLLGELLFSSSRNGALWRYALGLLLAAPGVVYSRITGNSVFAKTAVTIASLILQIVYATAVTFLFLLLFPSRNNPF